MVTELFHITRMARLYTATEAVSDVAVRVGGDIRTGRILAPDPPRPYGLLLCPSGFGWSGDGTALVAALWGPMPDRGGFWVTAWADTRELVAWAVSEGIYGPEDTDEQLKLLGPLYLITGAEIRSTWAELGSPAEQRATGQQQYVQTSADIDPAGTLLGAMSTLLGVWHVASDPARVERISAPPRQREFDELLDLVGSKIHRIDVATAERT
jgi:hypothetical protein